ncbi:TPA: A24 family peptidase, partial [Neisseria meningitidis]
GFVPLQSAVLGAVAGYGSIWLLCAVYKLIKGEIGMGNGDFKLIAALGAWLGISALPVLIFVSSLIGLVAAIVMRVAKGQHFAFGPALTVSGWIIFTANDSVWRAVNWWLTHPVL